MKVLCLVLLAFVAAASASTAATDLFVRDSFVYIGGEQTEDTGPAGNAITTFHTSTQYWSTFNWGCNGAVRHIQVVDGNVYLAGDFNQCDNEYVGPFVRYDIDRGIYEGLLPRGTIWDFRYDVRAEEWGNPITIRDMQFHRGKLYLGGLFGINFTDSRVANNIAMYDPRNKSWKTFGDGVDGTVHSIFVQDEKTLFIGGTFERAGWPNRGLDPLPEPYFWVWHEDHPVYGTGFGTFPIAIADNEFAPGWQLDGPVRQIWRGMLQMEPNGERLNPPIGTPEPARYTLVLVGDFTGGILFQQDSLPWQRPHGGLWGGSVNCLFHVEEESAFFIGGAFTHAGAENSTDEGAVALGGFVRWNYQNQVPRGGDWQDSRTWESNSNSQPHWDDLEGGVTDGQVNDMTYAPLAGLVILAGSFEQPHRFLTAYDVAKHTYDPFGRGDEFNAVLHTALLGVYQPAWTDWVGVWTDNTHFGDKLVTCVVENRITGTFGLGVIEGTVAANGRGASGSYFLAGSNAEGNSGRFGLVLDNDGNGFTGWYTIDGQAGRWEWTERRWLSNDQPGLEQCNDINRWESETLAGGWIAQNTGEEMGVCITGDHVTASVTNGRYYRGTARHGLKTGQVSYWDAEGYGVALWRQTRGNLLVENWFRGDYRDISADRCVNGQSCVLGKRWVRKESPPIHPCDNEAFRASWAGMWSLDRLNAVLYVTQAGDGELYGAAGPFLLQGRAEGNRATGVWLEAGWDELVGVIKGEFDLTLTDEGRTFEGVFTIPFDIDGNLLVNGRGEPTPIQFRWASQRLDTLSPAPVNSFVPASDAGDAGKNLNGRWLKDDGTFIDLCRRNPEKSSGAQYVGSTSDGRFYAGDSHDSGLLAALSWYHPETKALGTSLIRRVSRETVQEVWFTGNALSLDLNDCNSETCQLTDRGSGVSPVYTYVGPTSEKNCMANVPNLKELFPQYPDFQL